MVAGADTGKAWSFKIPVKTQREKKKISAAFSKFQQTWTQTQTGAEESISLTSYTY